MKHYAFIDAAEGSRSGDSMCLGIAHKQGAKGILNLVVEVEPPFSPGSVIVGTFAPLVKKYGCRVVTGDRHAAGFVEEAFGACGIKFEASQLDKSDLFLELLHRVNTGAVELLDHPTLRTQLLALQRRSVRGGRDSIDHPRGGHDDLANVAAGALVGALGIGVPKKKQAHFSFGPKYAGRSAGAMEHGALRQRVRDAERAIRAAHADPALELRLREELVAAQRALMEFEQVPTLATLVIKELDGQAELTARLADRQYP
jgi:hypothetical protein